MRFALFFSLPAGSCFVHPYSTLCRKYKAYKEAWSIHVCVCMCVNVGECVSLENHTWDITEVMYLVKRHSAVSLAPDFVGFCLFSLSLIHVCLCFINIFVDKCLCCFFSIHFKVFQYHTTSAALYKCQHYIRFDKNWKLETCFLLTVMTGLAIQLQAQLYF